MRYFLLFLIILLVSCSKRELEPDIQIPQFEMLAPVVANAINITNEVDTLSGGYLSPIYILNSNVMPIASGDISLGDNGFSIVSVATQYGKGKVMAVGHEGLLLTDGKYDNLKFFVNSMKWLNSDNKKILIKNGFANINNMTVLLKELESNGFTITNTNNKITENDLKNVGIVLFGNDWNNAVPYSESEVLVIKNFVQNGGGVLIAGLGWSYTSYCNPKIDDYAMNSIAIPFGFKFSNELMWNTPIVTNFYPLIEDWTLSGSIKNIRTIIKDYPNNLIPTLQNNEAIRKKFTNANVFIGYTVNFLPKNDILRDTIYNFYTKLIRSHSEFKKGKVYDQTSESSIIWNRERIHGTLINTKELTSNIIDEIGVTLGLTDEYLSIWKNNQIVLFDNSKLDKNQKKFAQDILSLIPSKLHNLSGISFSDFLGKTYSVGLGGSYGSVNSFSYPIGQYPENQFPNDVSPGVTSVFCSALSHEINHIVDAYYINVNEKLFSRKNQIIKQAGTISSNYLRGSSTPDFSDFFTNNPQEFFASLSNEWFTNSEKVLELAIIRFNKKSIEPINQFLFYADIYSLGTNSTIFYYNDLNGNISSKKIPITRDNQNMINSITVNNKTYNFVFNTSGNVISIN